MENKPNKSSKVLPIILILLAIVLLGAIIFTIKAHLNKMEENDPNNKSNKELIFESASAYLDATKNQDQKRMKKYLLNCYSTPDSDYCNEQVQSDIDHIEYMQKKNIKLLKIEKKNIKISDNKKEAEVTIDTDNNQIIIYLEKEQKQWYVDFIV